MVFEIDNECHVIISKNSYCEIDALGKKQEFEVIRCLKYAFIESEY